MMTRRARWATTPVSRRTFLVASMSGAAGYTFGLTGNARPGGEASAAPVGGGLAATGGARAKSTILFFLSGGASHLDMWDMKPLAPSEYRGPFQPITTSAPGVRLCEHLPLLAKQAHHLSLVNSVNGKVNTNDHHAGYYHNLTGHVPDPTFLQLGNSRTPYPDDWPFMGAVVAAKRAPHPHLPNAITLPQKEGAPAYTRPGQFAARLGLEYDPLYVDGDAAQPLKFQAPALNLEGKMTPERLRQKHALLRELDEVKREFDQVSATRTWTRQQQRALTLLLSSRTTEAFDVAREPAALRERYGETVNGMSLLLAWRLVEAEVPFVTVFWRGDLKKAEKRKCASGGGLGHARQQFQLLEGRSAARIRSRLLGARRRSGESRFAGFDVVVGDE